MGIAEGTFAIAMIAKVVLSQVPRGISQIVVVDSFEALAPGEDSMEACGPLSSL